jgi:hypothetical protein
MKGLVTVALACSLVGLGAAPVAGGPPTECVGTFTGVVFESVVVPEGATCRLSGTRWWTATSRRERARCCSW